MDEEQKYLLDKLLSRIDFYINTVNIKAAFVIAFDTFILGAILLKYNEIIQMFYSHKIQQAVTILFFVIFLGVSVSLFMVFMAVLPFLKSGNKPSTYHSLLFFGSVSETDIDSFKRNVNALTRESLLDDMIQQAHLLCTGLSSKFEYMRKSILWTILSALIPIGAIVFFKLIDWLLS